MGRADDAGGRVVELGPGLHRARAVPLVLAVATGVCSSGKVRHSILRDDVTTLVTQTLIEPDSRCFVPPAWPEPGRGLLADKDGGQWWMDAASGELARIE